MKLAVITNEILKEEFLLKEIPASIEIVFINGVKDIPAGADVVIDLLFKYDTERIAVLKQFLPKPVIINSVTFTLAVIECPFTRINAWPTFLKRNITELTVLPTQEDAVKDLFKQLGWNYQLVPDISGMISARVVAMVVNEAYFTFGEAVSTKEEIDTAMKLGTNYPFGPFEWSERIGLENIYELLVTLNESDKRYEIAPALTAEVKGRNSC
jgi:3-hydroxybutyryl-CoA dehydrogenase